jgi:hypothetical protein
MSVFPLPQTDLAYGYGTGYAKNCEAVEDRGADLDLCNLTLEVARRKALAKQFYTMHPLTGRVMRSMIPRGFVSTLLRW